MELCQHRISHKSRADRFHIIPIGDIHIGSLNCDKDKFQRQIDYIASKDNVRWIGMGDYADCITFSDKRFDPRNIDPEFALETKKKIKYLNLDETIEKQYQYILKSFTKIQDKCLGLMTGNHEEKIRLSFNRDITRDLARAMSVPYLGFCSLIRLRFTRLGGTTKTFDIYATHSNIAGRRSGGKVNRLEDIMGYFDDDIYFIAHGHKKFTTSITQLSLQQNGLKLKTKKKVGGMTGSFLKGYTADTMGYAERGGYMPADLGVINVSITPSINDIHISQ
jgi:hypothetical protein